jgi:hypothetical protein
MTRHGRRFARQGALALLLLVPASLSLGRVARSLPIVEEEHFDAIRGDLPAPSSSGDSLFAVVAALERGDLDEARARVLNAIREEPERGAAWELDGVIKAIGGDSAGAEISFGKAMALAPEASGPVTKLAIVKVAAGDRAGPRGSSSGRWP